MHARSLCFIPFSPLIVQATIAGFLSKGLTAKEGENLLEKSVKLALEARDNFWKTVQRYPEHNYNYALVAASVGSYGAYLADGSEYRYMFTSHFQF